MTTHLRPHYVPAVSPLGVILQSIRRDWGREQLDDMARRLGLSAVHLSDIELGKKNVPPGLEEMVSDLYCLDGPTRKRLFRAARQTRNTYLSRTLGGTFEIIDGPYVRTRRELWVFLIVATAALSWAAWLANQWGWLP